MHFESTTETFSEIKLKCPDKVQVMAPERKRGMMMKRNMRHTPYPLRHDACVLPITSPSGLVAMRMTLLGLMSWRFRPKPAPADQANRLG